MQTIKLLEKELDELDKDNTTFERLLSLYEQIEALQPPEYVHLSNVEPRSVRMKSGATKPKDPTLSVLNGMIKALADANRNMIGVCRSHRDFRIQKLLEDLNGRIRRDSLFDVVVKAAVTKEPLLESIQQEIGSKLDLNFDRENTGERARVLWDRIRQKKRILIILCDVCEGMDLRQVGIPFGADHPGCKILLTSASEEILSNEMQGDGRVFFMPSEKNENFVPSPPPIPKKSRPKMFQKLRFCWT